MFQEILGISASVLVLVSSIPYIRSILRGESKPSRASNFIWFFSGIVSASSYLAAGATTTKWLSLACLVNSTLIFALSIKYGMGGLKRFDIGCLLVALVSIFAWNVTHDPAVAVYCGMVGSVAAYLPLYRKVYKYPLTENKLSWVIYLFGCICNVFALTTMTFAIAGPIILGLLNEVTVVALLYRGHIHHLNLHWPKLYLHHHAIAIK